MPRVGRGRESGQARLFCSRSGQRPSCSHVTSSTSGRSKEVRPGAWHLFPCGWDGMGSRTMGVRDGVWGAGRTRDNRGSGSVPGFIRHHESRGSQALLHSRVPWKACQSPPGPAPGLCCCTAESPGRLVSHPLGPPLVCSCTAEYPGRLVSHSLGPSLVYVAAQQSALEDLSVTPRARPCSVSQV